MISYSKTQPKTSDLLPCMLFEKTEGNSLKLKSCSILHPFSFQD